VSTDATATMGSLYSKLCSELCSKPSTHEGGHTILNNNTLGGQAVNDGANPSDPRVAAAEAAERRAREAQQRGIIDGGGKLAKKTAAAAAAAAQEEQRLVWD